MPGVVSRAVSAWTATIETWWATTSCSSRAIRARSWVAACSRSVSVIACRVASRSASAWPRWRRASPSSWAAITSTAITAAGMPPLRGGDATAAKRNGVASNTEASRRRRVATR
jgi:hypothetical protein